MLKQILGAFSHMSDIDDKAKKQIAAEIERIEKGAAPKKKEDVAVKPEEGSKNQ